VQGDDLPDRREWEQRSISAPKADYWCEASLKGMLRSPRFAGLREWQGSKYPA
jgi:hypothetical protein